MNHHAHSFTAEFHLIDNFLFTGKNLQEWRQAETKSKKQSFLCARENEKLQDAMLEVRNTKNAASNLHLHHQKQISDKESAKVKKSLNS